MALPDPSADTTVVVTGASSGIGEALAREVAGLGHNVSLVARRKAKLARLADDLRADHGIEVGVHAADLSRDRSRARLLRELRGGRAVVGLCNNAGTGAFGNVLSHEVAEEETVFRTNALALFDLTNHLVRDMVARGEGAVLNTASILAFAPIPQNATYAATKAFIVSFSEALHTELQGTGVSCTTVSPGPTRTAIFDNAGAHGFSGFGPGVLWQDASDVAREAVAGMVAGRRSVIPGWTNKAAAFGLRFSARTALLPITRVAQSEPVRRRLLGEEQRD
jgi:short-subunit dehydrogenase